MENKSVLDALGEEEQEPDWSDKSRKCTFCEKIAPNELFVCDEHWDQYKDGIPTPAWQTEKKDCKHYIINKCIENDYDCNFCPFGITGRKRRAEQAQEDADKSLDEVLPHFDKVLLPKKTIFPKVKEPDIDIPTPKVQEWACFKCNLQGKTGVPICMGLCADHYVELNQIENKLINKILADLRELETNGHWDYVMPEEIKEDLKRELKYKIADYEGMLKK